MSALAPFAVLFAFAELAMAATWGCYGTKPGHATPSERAAFVREASALAVAAEVKYGVPASALAALAIIESGYGYTRLALEANNLFAWKHVRADRRGRPSYVPICQRDRVKKDRYAVFRSRADAFEFVASRLATLGAYREYTESYRQARRRGEPAEAAVRSWIDGIARRYSRKPEVFVEKMLRVMDDPEQSGTPVAPERTLHELSRKVSQR